MSSKDHWQLKGREKPSRCLAQSRRCMKGTGQQRAGTRTRKPAGEKKSAELKCALWPTREGREPTPHPRN